MLNYLIYNRILWKIKAYKIFMCFLFKNHSIVLTLCASMWILSLANISLRQSYSNLLSKASSYLTIRVTINSSFMDGDELHIENHYLQELLLHDVWVRVVISFLHSSTSLQSTGNAPKSVHFINQNLKRRRDDLWG